MVKEFCRIQNLHISQTNTGATTVYHVFCRIQNLHISQTKEVLNNGDISFVEFKIYISLKR